MLGAALLMFVATAPDPASRPHIEELEEGGVKGLRATFLVQAPPDQVLQTLWDVKRFRDIFPDIHTLTVEREAGDEIDVRFFVDAVLADVSYTLRRTRDVKKGTIVWRSIAGDLRSVRGSWTVRPTAQPDVSEVVYTSFVDVAAVVPTALVRSTAQRKVQEMAVRVRGACHAPVLAGLRTDAASTASRPPSP